jgi:lipopolysaccharide export system protein LptA
VKSRQIRAFLSAGGGDSRLEKAFADGGAEISQSSPKGTSYKGSAERSEYYTDEQKVILLGGTPTVVDSKGTRSVAPGGFTYWANDDRLVVNGSANQPANTRLKRK